MPLTITNNLTISNIITFGGTKGFTTLNYSQIVAGSIVTLKSGVTYTVTGQLTITGTPAQRCVLKGDTTITPNPTGSVSGTTTLSITSGNITVPTPTAAYNWLLSQSTSNTGTLRKPVLQMNNGSDVSNILSFPVINSPYNSLTNSFTISRSFNMSNRGITIGLSAKFIHSASQASRNINYVNTFDIDSRTSNGTILANNSYQNKVGVILPNLWRTVNWDSVQPLLPNITVAYIE